MNDSKEIIIDEVHLLLIINKITVLSDSQTTIDEKECGVASTVFRARLVGEPERWIAIKSSPAKRKFSPEPHDIIKEIELLSRISHINVRSNEYINLLRFAETHGTSQIDHRIRWVKTDRYND